MYCQIALCLALAVGAYAQGNMGMMGNGGGMNMNMLSNLLQGHNMMGNMGNNMMGNMGNNMMGNMGNNMGNNMMGNMGMGGGNGMMGPMLMTMLQSMMQQHHMGGMRGDSESSDSSDSHSADSDEMPSKDDMRKLEDMMKMEFAMEVARFVMVYQEYETKMKAFKEAMEGLCLGVEASFEHAKEYNVSVNETLEAEVNAIGERIDAIEDRDMQVKELAKLIEENKEAFGYGFFKVATMACKTGDEYMKAAEKMERMDRGNGDCDECKDKKKK